MYVIDVIPVASGAPGGSLSYRSRELMPLGSIVMVKLRKKEVPGVVVGAEEVRDQKATIKRASYTLSGTISAPVGELPPPLMHAVVETAVWHAAPVGSVLSQLLSTGIDASTSYGDTLGTGFSVDTVEAPVSERKARYRAFIDSAQGTTLLLVSTLAEVAYWKKALADFSLVCVTGALKEEKRHDALQKAREASLVITTPHFAWLPLPGLTTILIERAGAGGFRLPKRPYLDMRVALLALARAYKLRLVYGDYPLPLEYRAGTRSFSGSEGLEVIDARKEREEGTSWSAVPDSIRERIAKELLQGGRIAVFAARKGYAPVVICRDCGQTLKDERGKVFAYTQEGGKRLFRTADGKSEQSTKRNCPHCDSWHLLPLGVGVERVYEELVAAFPKAPIALFDADNTRTVVGARRKLAPLAELGSIIVGTEGMAPWLLAASPAPLSLAVIVSADSLLALPFWRARERFLRLGLLLPSLAPHALVATRLPEDAAVQTLRNGTNPVFFDEETSLRKALGYPPFGTLISLSWQGGAAALDTLEKQIRELLVAHSLQQVPDRMVRGSVLQRTLVLHLPENVWPDTALSGRLASLPPSVRVMVDPESFW